MRRLPAFLLVPAILLAGCAPLQSTKGVQDPQHGKEVWIGVTPLRGVQDLGVNGVAIGHYFSDDTYLATFQLNVKPPARDMQYQVWLVRMSPLEQINVGELTSSTSDARHRLQFSARRDLREYVKVLVTLERGKPSKPSLTVIAEGTLQKR
ncbi:MAG: hypothetical protein Greene041619_195 [Candidatus Peregrinibacteria bacterium Greene0416_19]|nr:MAG: hypothetical protein Greene041619_195 [Candidatus Peregrinibacteria bacterium Greene0416_19]